MGTFIEGKDLGSAWLAAYTTLEPTGELINLAVNITDPQQEDLGVRRAIEQRLVRAGVDGAQSMHTVANTIFPLGLYRPETENAAVRFMANVEQGQSVRKSAKARWGTYIGRLTAYPSRDGEPTNQLDLALRRLKRTPHYDDAYEMPLAVPGEADPVVTGMQLHGDIRVDSLTRGGPCLAHISLTAAHRRLSMVAIYRRHAYETRAYGNFLGLARLLAFLARESEHEIGELMVVTGHAVTDLSRAHSSELLKEATDSAGDIAAIETSARPLGATYADLRLPDLLR